MKNELEEHLLHAMLAALDIEGLPVVVIPITGPPPDPEFYLSMMRFMITSIGEATGCITFNTSDGNSGMLPLLGVDPQSALRILIGMREANVLASVNWVVLASDTYRRTFDVDVDPDSIQRGDLERMRVSGDQKVEDVLMVLCVAPDGPGYDVSQAYRKTDDGIEWDEVLPPPSTAHQEGPIHELMADLVTA